MADFVEVKVTGLKELQEALERKGGNIAKRIMRKCVRKAVEVWQTEMQRLAPKLEEPVLSSNPQEVRVPGDLSRHIGVKVSVRGDELEATANVGPMKRVFWGRFLEFGTRKMAAQPFIRPSFESKKDEVLNTFIAEAKKVVDEEAKEK